MGSLPRLNASVFFQDAGLYRPQLKSVHPLLQEIRPFECEIFQNHVEPNGTSANMMEDNDGSSTPSMSPTHGSSWNSFFGKLIRAIHAHWPEYCLAPDAGGGIGIELGLVLLPHIRSSRSSQRTSEEGMEESKKLSPLLPAPSIIRAVGLTLGRLILLSNVWERFGIEVLKPLSKVGLILFVLIFQIFYVNIYSSSDELIILLHAWKVTLIPWAYGGDVPRLEFPFLKSTIESSNLPQASLYSPEEFQIVSKILSFALGPFSRPFSPTLGHTIDVSPSTMITKEDIEILLTLFKLLLLPPVVLKDAIRLFSLSGISGILENGLSLISATAALSNACKMTLILSPAESFQVFPVEGLVHFQVMMIMVYFNFFHRSAFPLKHWKRASC